MRFFQHLTGEVLTLTINSVHKAEIDFSERPLIERKLDELRGTVESSAQYDAVTSVLASENIDSNISKNDVKQ